MSEQRDIATPSRTKEILLINKQMSSKLVQVLER